MHIKKIRKNREKIKTDKKKKETRKWQFKSLSLAKLSVSHFLWQSIITTDNIPSSFSGSPSLPPLSPLPPPTPKRTMMSSLCWRSGRKRRKTRRMLMNPRHVKTGRVWSVVVPGTVLFRSGLLWLDNLVRDEVLRVCLQERERKRGNEEEDVIPPLTH